MRFNTHDASGNYAIRLMIEDLDDQRQPLSKVSLSFLLYVDPDNSDCAGPKILTPNVCKTIVVDQSFTMDVVAETSNNKR